MIDQVRNVHMIALGRSERAKGPGATGSWHVVSIHRVAEPTDRPVWRPRHSVRGRRLVQSQLRQSLFRLQFDRLEIH